jgi:predicted transcriptional regulator
VAKSHPGSEPETDKEKRRKRSLANLEKSRIKKGEIRNPTGVNGRTRSDLIVSILEEPDDDKPSITRIRAVVLATVDRAKLDSDMAAKTVIEQYAGKARQQVDLTNSDGSLKPNTAPTTAEARHELDQALAAIEARTTKEAPKDKAPEADEATAAP